MVESFGPGGSLELDSEVKAALQPPPLTSSRMPPLDGAGMSVTLTSAPGGTEGDSERKVARKSTKTGFGAGGGTKAKRGGKAKRKR